MHHYHAHEPLDVIDILAVVVLRDEGLQHVGKPCLLDVHEEATDVALENPSFGMKTHELRNTIDAVVGAFANSAIVGVIDEGTLEQRHEAKHDQVMHYSVTELCCEHFPNLRPCDTKCVTLANGVGVLIQFLPKIIDVGRFVRGKLRVLS